MVLVFYTSSSFTQWYLDKSISLSGLQCCQDEQALHLFAHSEFACFLFPGEIWFSHQPLIQWILVFGFWSLPKCDIWEDFHDSHYLSVSPTFWNSFGMHFNRMLSFLILDSLSSMESTVPLASSPITGQSKVGDLLKEDKNKIPGPLFPSSYCSPNWYRKDVL